ncbi:MAG: SH3 domain-containing protein [Candidatus Hydrogenedentes bacterium]|nr:SH3 domain-containing protein [Candidatus Hydrogenedentota bacterium]
MKIPLMLLLCLSHALADVLTAAAGPFPMKTLPPPAAAIKDPALQSAIEALKSAVKSRDMESLLKIVHPEVKVDFGGAGGLEDFRKAWALDQNPLDSPLWKALDQVLAFEGATEGDYYIFPYFFALWPDEFDGYEFAIVSGAKVNIRRSPDTTAGVIRQASYEIVRMEESPEGEQPESTIGDETHPWRKVGLSSGETGYVWGKFLRSPLDFRLGLRNFAGVWKLAFFLAGD